jgi:hypothetical protein
MQAHSVTRESLVKLPLVFIGIGVLVQIGSPIPAAMPQSSRS